MRKLICISVLIMSVLSCQKKFAVYSCIPERCTDKIFIDRYNESFIFYHNPDTVRIYHDSVLVKLFTINVIKCEGNIYIREYDPNHKMLIFEGGYIPDKDTTLNTFYIDPTADPIQRPATVHYYIPQRNGTWKYYDTTGTLYKTEIYKNGLLIK